jgi:uncharacterized protein YndB with AHSA1/START domain
MREEKNAVISDRIEREIVIEAPPEVIWGVVTEPDQMSRWLCDTADFEVQPGAYGSVAEGSAASIADHERGRNTYLAQLRDYIAVKPRVVAP